MREGLVDKRKLIMQDENVIEVGLVTGDNFSIRRGSYLEHDDKNMVGTGGIVTFMNKDTNALILTYVHHISHVAYFIPSGYEEDYDG